LDLNKVKYIKQNIDILENSRESIIDIWTKDVDVNLILIKHDIDKKLFESNYAHPVLSYFIGVVKCEKEIGNCPVMKKLLEYFKERDISSSELFIICVNFRKAIIKKFFQTKKMNEDMYENVSYVFDANFRGVLELFEHTVSQAQAETKRIYEDSIRDHLTKLFNRKKFDEILLQEIKFSQSNNIPLSMILLDIDNFKNTNDTFGHDMGDDVLMAFATIIKKYIRDSDIVARWGGEEFVMLLPKSTKENAFIRSEQIRIEIQNYDFETVGKITCSFGISQIEENDNPNSLFNKADKALYHSKHNGKNMVTIS